MIPNTSAATSSAGATETGQPIRVLQGALVDQIAAGEVVERPANVVKELLENALDAGAQEIVVEVDGGGIDRIAVTDDGHGIPRNEVKLALQRHATSKIRRHEDLQALSTFGFRGEALPSIASVARVTLTSRVAGSDAGTRGTVVGGDDLKLTPTGARRGTTVDVRDLFFNVPVRRKFLKSPGTENALVAETCLRAALQRPSLRLTLLRNGTRAREYFPANDLEARAAEVFHQETLRTISGTRPGIRVSAFLAAPERARQGAKGLHVLVNGRPLRDRTLARSVAFAYGSVLPPGRYPVGVVSIEVDPAEVDVNVHPQKAEVRFAEGRKVLDAVTRILAAGLGETPWQSAATAATMPSDSLPRSPNFWNERLSPSARPDASKSSQVNPPSEATSTHGPQTHSVETHIAEGSADLGFGLPLAPGSAFSAAPSGLGDSQEPHLAEALPHVMRRGHAFAQLRVVAQVRRMILLCEGPRSLVLIDQHAADERVRYAQLRKSYEAQDVAVQRLLFPERVEVAESDAALAEEQSDALLSMGLEVTRVGPTSVSVAAVPSIVRRASPTVLVRAAVGELSRSGEREFGDAVDTALATMACHAAIRAGDVLSLTEGQALLAALDAAGDFAGHCPHGRPVLMEIPWTEVERKLGR